VALEHIISTIDSAPAAGRRAMFAVLSHGRHVLQEKPAFHQPPVIWPRRPRVPQHRHRRYRAVPRLLRQIGVGPVPPTQPGERLDGRVVSTVHGRPCPGKLSCLPTAVIEEEQLLILSASHERRGTEVVGNINDHLVVASAVRQVDVGDGERAVLVEDIQDLVCPVRLLQCNLALVASNLEGLVAALGRVPAGEPEGVGDVEAAARRRRAWPRRRRIQGGGSGGGGDNGQQSEQEKHGGWAEHSGRKNRARPHLG
jgi:hypothetical protein